MKYLIILLLFGCTQKVEYKDNEMVNGCVMQKTADHWIKTCG